MAMLPRIPLKSPAKAAAKVAVKPSARSPMPSAIVPESRGAEGFPVRQAVPNLGPAKGNISNMMARSPDNQAPAAKAKIANLPFVGERTAATFARKAAKQSVAPASAETDTEKPARKKGLTEQGRKELKAEMKRQSRAIGAAGGKMFPNPMSIVGVIRKKGNTIQNPKPTEDKAPSPASPTVPPPPPPVPAKYSGSGDWADIVKFHFQPKMKSGGLVRGCGVAKRGVKKARNV